MVLLFLSNQSRPLTSAAFSIPLLTSPPSRSSTSSITYEDAIRALYAPLLHPITADYFVDPTDGGVYGTNQTIWTNPLGKNLCIVDVDTRPLNETNELMSEEFNWQTIEGVSTGMLNHYLYGMSYKPYKIHSTNLT
jgi:hypothetical protein